MPFIGGSITGNVVAKNLNGDAVPLPATVTIDPPSTSPRSTPTAAWSTTTPPKGASCERRADAPLAQIVSRTRPRPSPARCRSASRISPRRRCTISRSRRPPDTTHRVPIPSTSDVDPVAPTDVGTPTYVAQNVSVVVQFARPEQRADHHRRGDALPARGGAALTPSAANGDYTFSSVPPDLRNYLLSVTDAFHQDLVNDPATVLPEADGNLTITRTLASDAGIIRASRSARMAPALSRRSSVPALSSCSS